ncbi:MAG: amidohydrolase family protein [Proteobacteria bacterium]|nr:amidohydrolase family protein [Pseudomonadota bacterium]
MMKRFIKYLLVFAFFVTNPAIVVAQNFQLGSPIEEAVLIVNVTILPMDGSGPIENAEVFVTGGRIETVSTKLFVADVEIIDGTGKYLVPGMAEMHGHIPGGALNQDLEDLLFLYVSQGVTTVRGMLGADGQFELRDKINSGEVLGPTLYLGGPSFNGNSVSSPNQARRMVRGQVEEGWDFLKIHPGMTLAEYDAMADEAARLGIPWGGHVPEDVGLARALEAGQRTIDHLDGFDIFVNGVTKPLDQGRLDQAVELMLDAGAYVVPTNHLWETLLGLPEKADLEEMDELKYLTPAARRQNRSRYSGQSTGRDLVDARHNAANRRQILESLSGAGAGILLGSDAPQLYSVPGFSLMREMEAMAASGMSPEAILRSGTATAGEFFSNKDKFGMIAPGHRADLILLDANPLEDISNMRSIAGVMVRGIWLSRAEIEARLAEIEERNKGGSFF